MNYLYFCLFKSWLREKQNLFHRLLFSQPMIYIFIHLLSMNTVLHQLTVYTSLLNYWYFNRTRSSTSASSPSSITYINRVQPSQPWFDPLDWNPQETGYKVVQVQNTLLHSIMLKHYIMSMKKHMSYSLSHTIRSMTDTFLFHCVMQPL